MSWQATVYRLFMSAQRRFLFANPAADPTAESRRARTERMMRFLKPPADVRWQPVKAGGVPGEWITTPAAAEDGLHFHLHGGAYIVGSVATSRDVIARIGRAAGLRSLAVDYRLAPQHPFPAALEDALVAYRWILAQGIDPAQTVVVGDSAGGGLALALLVSLRDSDQPLPAAAVLISPWTDLSMSGGSVTEKARADPINKPDIMRRSAAMYAAETDPRHPLISPVFADLGGLPPLLIHVGSEETLRDDAVRVAKKAQAAGVEVSLKVWPGMIHVFHYAAAYVPEGRQAVDEIGAFIRGQVEQPPA